MEHTFSVEMKSKKYVKNISISDEAHDRVLFEGNLGELSELSLVEDVLEFIGVNGVLRVGLTEDQIRKALKFPPSPNRYSVTEHLRNLNGS